MATEKSTERSTGEESAPDSVSTPLAIAAVILYSSNADGLARFYRENIGIPLRRISASGVAPHWACDIRYVYFSIWPVQEESDVIIPDAYRGGVAFYVKNVKREFERLVAKGIRVEHSPRLTPLGVIARLRDPDGNIFELYQPA